MSRSSDRAFVRLALIGALFVALGLAACGRKGALDPPPGASIQGVPQANMPDIMSHRESTPVGGQAQKDNPGIGPDGQPLAPKGPKKQIPLDVLLN